MRCVGECWILMRLLRKDGNVLSKSGLLGRKVVKVGMGGFVDTWGGMYTCVGVGKFGWVAWISFGVAE